jgi:hypothetical protein
VVERKAPKPSIELMATGKPVAIVGLRPKAVMPVSPHPHAVIGFSNPSNLYRIPA